MHDEKWRIAQTLRQAEELGRWLDSKVARQAFEGNLAATQCRARGANGDALIPIINALPGLPAYLIGDGARKLRARDPDGWRLLREAVLCMHWWRRASLAFVRSRGMRPGGGSIGGNYLRFAHCASLAWALSGPELADWFAKECILMDDNGTASASTRDRTFPLFVARAARAWVDRQDPAASVQSADLLNAALSTMRDDVQFASSAVGVIDYHLSRCDIRPKAGSGDDGYFLPGLALVPTPAIALTALRARLYGARRVTIEHPAAEIANMAAPAANENSSALLSEVEPFVVRIEATVQSQG